MDVQQVMTRIAERVNAGLGIRAFEHPVDSVTAPAAVVLYPTTIDYDATYGRGSDTMTIPLTVLIGRLTDKETAAAVARYAAGSGAGSVKEAIEAASEDEDPWDVARVASAEFDYLTIGGVSYVGAAFDIEITGRGA